MYIERLHLKGFKSFGSPQDLLFSPGLTAIVGPNGSGKSNLLDALRWVLGDGGLQRLRIVKQVDLLFSGSVSLSPAACAEVTLSIREDKSAASKNCVLKRTYSPETGAVITVDGVRMRLSDLDEVKRLWRLEGDQFAFIGQGEVAEAIRQRPAQRRAHLEVLFGVDQYRKKRNETSVKLAAAGEEHLRLGALMAELTHRREEITPAVAIAAKAQKITDELEEKRRSFYFYRRCTLGENLAALEERLLALREEEALRVRWRDLWEKMHGRSLRERGELEERIKCLRGDRDEILRRRAELGRNCFASAASVREICARIRSIDDEEKNLMARRQQIFSEHEEIAEKERIVAAEHTSLAEERDGLRWKIAELHVAMETERTRKKKLTDTAAGLSAEKETLRSRILSKKTFLTVCESDRIAADESITGLNRGIAECEERILLLEKREAKVLEFHGDAFAACRKTALEVQHARKEAVVLEGTLENLRNAESASYPEPVRFLTSASRLGKLTMPLSVAAETFACPSSITGALEAYLGGRQYWVFVKTLSEAGKCIDLLKERRMGRATFLPLERSRPRSPDRSISLPSRGIVGWAMEIVTSVKEWEPCVFHLLGNLLIVEEYNTGAALLKKGVAFPIVSLEGEVFVPSGTVSGGKGKISGGAIERRRRIESAEERLEGLKKEIKVLAARLDTEELLERARSAEKETLVLELREAKKVRDEKRRDLLLETARKEGLDKERFQGMADIEAWEARMAAVEKKIHVLVDEGSSSAEDDETSALPARLAEVENAVAIREERLSSIRALLKRTSAELRRAAERDSFLREERCRALVREREEKEKLSVWGKEQYRLFLDLGEKEKNLSSLLKKEKHLTVRSGRISVRSNAAMEKAGAAREKIGTTASKKEAFSEELLQIMETWEEQYPYREGEIPSPEEGEAASAVMRRLERDLRALGPVEWGALSEDQSLASRIAFLTEQLSDVKNAVDELRNIIAETDRHVGVIFNEALENINNRFNSLFFRLFGGGEAKLRMQLPSEGGSYDDSGDEAETHSLKASSPAWDCGVEIVARPPGKHLQNLAQLSGGEQTLTAIAYLFASMEVAGVPLAVLDEVDAALDESNLLRFGELAREYASTADQGRDKGIQLLVMTHRRATMERADILYGVTLAEPGLSKVVGMKVEDWVEPAPKERSTHGGVRR